MLSLILAFVALVQAHMHLNFPATFNGSNNPFTVGTPDPYLEFPYDCCGPNARWEYPCRGYLSLLGTPAGAPTASWEAGSKQNWSMSGLGATIVPSGNHYGGSCQVGFSIDKGKTFRVATSYEGDCPHRNNGIAPQGQNFEMTVPADLPAGEAVFAWIWYNREQEFNMNCAAVNVTVPSGGSSSSCSSSQTSSYRGASATMLVSPESDSLRPTAIPDAAPVYNTLNGCVCVCESPAIISSCNCTCPAVSASISGPATISVPIKAVRDMPSSHIQHAHLHHRRGSASASTYTPAASSSFTPFGERPEMLIADDGNGCLTPHSTAELKYPQPGPEVVTGDGVYPLEYPTGDCSALGQQAYDGSTGNDGHP